ncbi:hypothetical protein [Candidatus Nitrosocosmicus hydrocola]|uniref:hypothetical protein n=1 Tax=Candidatus Nitrosocosmicus hydrocola TaxID=1826872 RepID=UPI0013732671|nr:hypothetical protein [Candidatus Nitrosocosmicus hydrocola]
MMTKSQNSTNHSPFLFVITLASALLLMGVGVTTTTTHTGLYSQIDGTSVIQSGPNLAFAQNSVATLANSASGGNDSLVFNNYENSEVGISIKYPSTFLIDESNSNETVKQVSFFPAYDYSSDYPQTYISWFDVYVEELYPPISDNPINISSYLDDQANSIQEEDADVTIVETSTDSMLSGNPAYKLVTRSYDGNSSIDDIEIGTIVGNTLYTVSYEVDTNQVQDSLPIANKMIYSFKINSLNNLADSISSIVNSSSIATIKEKVPFLEGLFSSLNMKNITNNPYSLLSSLGLNESTKSTLENFIANSSASTAAAGSLPSNLTSLMGSGLGSINSETLCSIQILSSLCKGDVFSNHSIPSFLGNESSFGGLSDLFNKSISSSGLLGDRAASILGNGSSSADEGFNLSELKNLLGPFAMLSSPSSDNTTNALFGDSGLASSLFSSSSSSSLSSLANNQTDSMMLDRLFSDTGFGNQTGFENDSSFNPFAALFGTNSTGLFGQFENQSSSVGSNSSDNSTLDIIRMLEFFQSGQ